MMARRGDDIPYQEIEYLETEGNAYINTKIVSGANDIIRAAGLAGFNTSSTSRRFIICLSSISNNFYCEFNASDKFAVGSSAVIDKTLSASTMYNISLTIERNVKTSISLTSNGETSTAETSQYMSGSSNLPIWLFRLSSGYKGIGQRIGRLKIWQNNVLVRDLIPVRVGTTGYMYDKVSGQLFGNAGTGDFILGNDI